MEGVASVDFVPGSFPGFKGEAERVLIVVLLTSALETKIYLQF